MPAPKTDGHETRAVILPVELRAADADGGGRTATGYAALFNVWTDIGPYWRERIAPGAFSASLRQRDVVALHSHDIGRVMGRTGAGTLSLREDEKGLAFENALPDTTDGRDLAVQIERKDIPGMSFGFLATREEWNETVEPPERTILEAELIEITYTALPAYPDTSVGMRSLAAARTERRPKPALSDIAARSARQAQIERGI